MSKLKAGDHVELNRNHKILGLKKGQEGIVATLGPGPEVTVSFPEGERRSATFLRHELKFVARPAKKVKVSKLHLGDIILTTGLYGNIEDPFVFVTILSYQDDGAIYIGGYTVGAKGEEQTARDFYTREQADTEVQVLR